MKLYEFLSERREELLAACVRIIKRDIPERPDDDVGEHLHGFIDEVARVLRRYDGIAVGAGSVEIRPADLARDRRRRGFRVEHLVPTYAALSVAVGEVAGRRALAFAADEYGVFNETIDKHVAEAIESFAEDTRREQDEALGERLGFLAHELRNALSSASMAFRMLERGHVGIHGHTADVIRRNHKRMETLIEQTLAAARMRSGSVRATLHEVALAPLLREIHSSTVLERGITIAIEADEALRVVADEHLLTTAISNLFQNAVKFSHDRVSILVRARLEDRVVAIEVEDGCGGLPEGKREELFKPFVQGKPDLRGAGLGLTITRDAVKALGGEITVRDVPRKGCVFSVRVPRAGAPTTPKSSA
jgi:signal transduction histidine kinase